MSTTATSTRTAADRSEAARKAAATRAANKAAKAAAEAPEVATGTSEADFEAVREVAIEGPAPESDPSVAAEKAPKAKAEKPRIGCNCGCGEFTRGGTYIPGHDARHAARVAAALVENANRSQDDEEMMRNANLLLADLSPRLKEKAATQAARLQAAQRLAAARAEAKRIMDAARGK